ncbi:MAG TPA: Rieske 2Fe-2S domain-containing protein [Candidatus Elarobacter sp.]
MPIAQQLVDLTLQTPGLDAAADSLAGVVNGAYDAAGPAKQPLKDALNGTWLGHSLHPAITDVPIGAWTAALALDALGERRGARIAVGVGLLGALGAAGGPLDEGALDGDVVTCPWHGSKFCVLDGGIVAGPTAYPQPAFRARVLDGRVRIAAAGPR